MLPTESGRESSVYLEQEIGAKKWEENDGRTAEEDQLEHGDDEPGQQQTSDQRRELGDINLYFVCLTSTQIKILS